MDWTSLGIAVSKLGAGTLASVFLGPEAGALAPVLIDKLAGLFGVAANPAAVQVAIQNDPDAAAKVKTVEAEHQDIIEAYLADLANARAMTVSLAQSPNSWLGWVSTGITGYILVAFTAICVLIIMGYAKESNLVLAVYGTFSGFAGIAVQFWLGSTKGGTERAEQITTMLRQTISPGANAAPAAARKR